MSPTIEGKRVAILATDGFQQDELADTKRLLDEAGARTKVVSLRAGEIKGWKDMEWAEPVSVDETVDHCSASDFDALFVPGGTINPDRLRANDRAMALVREFYDQGKPIGAICHGPWVLVEAGVVEGKRLTSWPSIKTDLKNAGALWEDSQVVADEGLVTSRKPDDIPAFAAKLIEEISEGLHDREGENGRLG